MGGKLVASVAIYVAPERSFGAGALDDKRVPALPVTRAAAGLRRPRPASGSRGARPARRKRAVDEPGHRHTAPTQAAEGSVGALAVIRARQRPRKGAFLSLAWWPSWRLLTAAAGGAGNCRCGTAALEWLA